MGKGKPEDTLTDKAIDLLAMKLWTPLQVQPHMTLALEVGYQTGEKPVTAALVESVLSTTLTRHGHRLIDIVEQFDAKTAEIRAMLIYQRAPARGAKLAEAAQSLPILRVQVLLSPVARKTLMRAVKVSNPFWW